MLPAHMHRSLRALPSLRMAGGGPFLPCELSHLCSQEFESSGETSQHVAAAGESQVCTPHVYLCVLDPACPRPCTAPCAPVFESNLKGDGACYSYPLSDVSPPPCRFWTALLPRRGGASRGFLA